MDSKKRSNKCAAMHCSNYVEHRYRDDGTYISFFHFPAKEQARLDIWIQNSGRLDYNRDRIGKYVFCEDHFEATAFNCPTDKYSVMKRKVLLPTAIPTLFDLLKPHQCDKCGTCFAKKYKLTIHVRKNHTDEKPTTKRSFKCEFCEKIFGTSSGRSNHTRWRHSGEKPFQCRSCTKSFTTSTTRKAHERTHTGEKPMYDCEICHQKFTTKSGLASHRRQTHTQKRNPTSGVKDECDICHKKFPKSSISKHVYIDHYCCGICKTSVGTKNELIKHLIAHTKEDPPISTPDGKPITQILGKTRGEIQTSEASEDETHTRKKPPYVACARTGENESEKRTKTVEEPGMVVPRDDANRGDIHHQDTNLFSEERQRPFGHKASKCGFCRKTLPAKYETALLKQRRRADIENLLFIATCIDCSKEFNTMDEVHTGPAHSSSSHVFLQSFSDKQIRSAIVNALKRKATPRKLIATDDLTNHENLQERQQIHTGGNTNLQPHTGAMSAGQQVIVWVSCLKNKTFSEMIQIPQNGSDAPTNTPLIKLEPVEPETDITDSIEPLFFMECETIKEEIVDIKEEIDE